MEILLGLKKEEFLTHQFILGATGKGKTRAMLNEYLSLVNQPNLSVALFSVEGNELGVLHLLEKNKNVFLLDAGINGNFRFDPLSVVEGSNVIEATDDFCRLMCTTFWLRMKGYAILKPIVKRILEDKLVGLPRTIYDLYEEVKKLKGETRDTILNRLDLILDTPFFNTTAAPRMDLLSKTNVIFMIESLDSYGQTFFINLFVNKLMRYKRAAREHLKSVENQHMNICIIDEAQRVTPASFIQREELPFHPLVQACNQGRKLGVGLIFIVQRPSAVEGSFLAQAGLILAGTIANEEDIRAVRVALGLNQDQLNYYNTMPKRVFLLKKSGTSAFPITIPHIEIKNENIDNNFIQSWNADIIKNDTNLLNIFSSNAEKTVIKRMTINDDSYKFIKMIYDNQCKPVTFYYNKFSKNKLFESQKANQLKKELIEKGFINCHKIKKGNGKFIVGTEITERGYEYYGLKPNLNFYRGSDFIHNYIAENIKTYYEQKGNTVIREKHINGHFVDLFFDPDCAIEISIGNLPVNEAKNIISNIDANLRTIVIGNDNKHIESIQKEMSEQHKESSLVEYRLFSEYF